MKKLFFLLTLGCLVAEISNAQSRDAGRDSTRTRPAQGNQTTQPKYTPMETFTKGGVKYPSSFKKDTTFTYFGNKVVDPYAWLEDDNSPKTAAWVTAENNTTEFYLRNIRIRKAIKDRYTELYNYEKVGAPSKEGDYYFYYKNSGLEPQGKIFVKNGLEGAESVFIDLNTLSDDGTKTASLLGASDDHRFMAVSYNNAGSDWSEIRVIDIATKKETGDVLSWVKFSGATWYGNGFYYSRYPVPQPGDELSASNLNHQVYYHKIGTRQAEDELVFSNTARPQVYNYVGLTEDKKYLLLYVAPGTDGYEVYFKNPADKEANFTPLFTDLQYHSSVVESSPDGRLIVLTDVDAPKYKLVSVDPMNPDKANWKTILPEGSNLLSNVSTGGGKLFATYLDKANTRVYVLNYDGTDKKEIALPDKTGSAGGLGGKKDDTFLFYTFTSFTYPGTIFKYDIASGKSEVFYQSKLEFDPSQYESKQVMYKSKDGTEVPMFIVHKKGIKLDGNNPTLLYGYGGFNISLQPSFSTSRMILLENGGVFAMANIRGGGEFGEEWHKAGMKRSKQTVFDDFIAAAEYLISSGYTSSERLAIEGGSNGGLLVGACMTQRPELFKVCFPAVGVLDMLRFHKFTVGKGWIPEYGCADSSVVEFNYLQAYSPYHNLKKGVKYPATMIFTADHDDRVVPAHSFKFAARLQEYNEGTNPTLIRIETKAGHGAGKSTDQIIEEQTDKWAFMFYNMKFNPFGEEWKPAPKDQADKAEIEKKAEENRKKFEEARKQRGKEIEQNKQNASGSGTIINDKK